jgi:GDP-L-fucose synthase
LKVVITGSTGLLGSAITKLADIGDSPLMTKGDSLFTPTSTYLNLLRQDEVRYFMKFIKPDMIIHCAARVGGVGANSRFPASFFHENTLMNTILVDEAAQVGTKSIIMVGSGCMYGESCPLPTKEDYLWDSAPHELHAPYAYAKRMMEVQAKAYAKQYGLNIKVVVPSNLYGPNDRVDIHNSHVVIAIIQKIVTAARNNRKCVYLWGDGTPKRDLLYVDDAAKAIITIAKNMNFPYNLVNIGSGINLTIKELVETISEIVAFNGRIVYDQTMPNGQQEKLLDITRIRNLGWNPETSLKDGLTETIKWFENAYLNKEAA